MLLSPNLKCAWRQQCDTTHQSCLRFRSEFVFHRRFISRLLMGLKFSRLLKGHFVLIIHREEIIAYYFPLVHINAIMFMPLGYNLRFTCFHFDMHKIILCLLL